MGKSYPGLFDQVDGISLRKHGTPSLRSAKLKWTWSMGPRCRSGRER